MLRPELEPLPKRIQNLPVDERGYPIPWFVDYDDNGKPEFRAMNPEKWMRAIKFKYCWTCGERLGRWMTFVAGPMCGINRTSAEPPSHKECAEWSARNCPFLNNPDAIRRVDEKVTGEGKCIGGHAIMRNPGVTMLWTTDTYSMTPDMRGSYVITMGEPVSVEWWTRSRHATRDEVVRSIEAGLPFLETVAVKQDGGLAHLQTCRERFEKWLPAESVEQRPTLV
jgi:hypothetical protein